MRWATAPVATLGVRGVVLCVPAMLAGLLGAVAFEPVSIGWLGPIAMAVFWWSLQAGSPRSALLLGACFGAAFSAVLLWWLVASVGLLAWMALSIAFTATTALAALGMRAVREMPAAPFWGAAIWVSMEMLRSGWPLGGMPWGQLRLRCCGYTLAAVAALPRSFRRLLPDGLRWVRVGQGLRETGGDPDEDSGGGGAPGGCQRRSGHAVPVPIRRCDRRRRGPRRCSWRRHRPGSPPPAGHAQPRPGDRRSGRPPASRRGDDLAAGLAGERNRGGPDP